MNVPGGKIKLLGEDGMKKLLGSRTGGGFQRRLLVEEGSLDLVIDLISIVNTSSFRYVATSPAGQPSTRLVLHS